MALVFYAKKVLCEMYLWFETQKQKYNSNNNFDDFASQ